MNRTRASDRFQHEKRKFYVFFLFRLSALTPPHPWRPHTNTLVLYSTDRSKAVVPVLVLLFVALWFNLRGDLFYVLLCVILFLCFSLFSIAITLLGEERANLSAFRIFVRFAICLILSVFSSSWCPPKGCGL